MNVGRRARSRPFRPSAPHASFAGFGTNRAMCVATRRNTACSARRGMTHMKNRIGAAALLGAAAAALTIAWPAPRLQAHGTEARYVELVQWKKPNIAKVFGVGASALGVPSSRNSLQMRMIENKACVVGNVVAFDVDDAYAFDVDELVTLAVTYAPALSTPFVVGWDKSGGNG